MKRTLMAVSLVVCTATLLGEPVKTAKNVGERRKALREARIAANGGALTRPLKGKYIALVNNQSRVKESELFSKDLSINALLHYVVKIVKPGEDVSGSALTITLSDDQSAPSLIVAPEVPWAGINVGALAADKPEASLLAKRLRKEIWRAFMYACGAANSMRGPCLMRPIFSLRDLDALPTEVPCPDSLPRVVNCAKALDLGVLEQCDYRRACEEGWAPAPTNELQKTIWDRVHQMPTEPLKIKPETKKVRE